MRVGMLAFPDMTQLDFTGPHEVFAQLPGTEVRVVAPGSGPVTARGGLRILPDLPIEAAPPFDLVFVPGGPGVGALLEDLPVLEYALDRFSFDHALETVKGDAYDNQILRLMIMAEIDVTNLKTVLKLIRDRAPADEAGQYFLKGGISLDLAKLQSLVRTGSIEAAVKQLKGTPYEFLGKIPAEVFIQEKISVIEKELDKYLIKKGVSQFFKDPLSIALAVGYLWAKYNEVTNIRIIARCKTADISEKELREELLYV